MGVCGVLKTGLNKENEIENRLFRTATSVTRHRLFLNRTRREDGGPSTLERTLSFLCGKG